MGLRGFARVMRCVQHMGMGGVRMMRGCIMMTGRVVPSSFLVMPCSMLVMLRSF
jgi:hypothetical protein